MALLAELSSSELAFLSKSQSNGLATKSELIIVAEERRRI
ncbi:hypothetical protein CCACVL1_21619 [Corchorus capsularis]|uniref:Uncharacterized protein n=1 Tax=Corchorus capsularis TaxID=210143 RepID=A0A1R3H2U7_COCAP|nr:hypothetical protein CCACVL1_21619 [Corchorus capsularis]